jgi:hypothetical protein
MIVAAASSAIAIRNIAHTAHPGRRGILAAKSAHNESHAIHRSTNFLAGSQRFEREVLVR